MHSVFFGDCTHSEVNLVQEHVHKMEAFFSSERVMVRLAVFLASLVILSSAFGLGALIPKTEHDVPVSVSKVAEIIGRLHTLKKTVKSESVDNEAGGTNDVESKGYSSGGSGYGHGGGGYGGGHGAITLDPVSIISLLALGAFLINNILQLLRMNQASGRSLDVSDMNLPLQLSDLEFQDTPILGRSYDYMHEEEDNSPNFAQFFANLGSLYYLNPARRNICVKKVVCNYANGKQTRSNVQRTLRTRIFDFMLMAITRFVAPEINERSGSGACEKYNKHCSDSVLEDAKIATENKVYSTVTSLVSNLAIRSLLSTFTG